MILSAVRQKRHSSAHSTPLHDLLLPATTMEECPAYCTSPISADFPNVWTSSRELCTDPASGENNHSIMSNNEWMNQDVGTSSLNNKAHKLAIDETIWVFEQGRWQRNPNLWLDVQKASWDEVFLKDELKKVLQRDVEGFFASESMFKDMSVSWKRGLLFHGPPGNGKALSLRAIMKTCGDRGINPLYVKSFNGAHDKETGMAAVFEKAREVSPCVVVLEDLELLIDEGNRSFFLNELDGISNNHGVLIIGTTSHLDCLGPALSDRTGRFDRKYHFQNPGDVERLCYVHYWIDKLKAYEIDVPLGTVEEIAWLSNSFSFAHLKEAFVSSIIMWNGIKGQKPSFSMLLKMQIETLRQQLCDMTPSIIATLPTAAATIRPKYKQRDPITDEHGLYRSEKSHTLDECVCPSGSKRHQPESHSRVKSSGSLIVSFIDRISNPGQAPPTPDWADNALFLFLVILIISVYILFANVYPTR